MSVGFTVPVFGALFGFDVLRPELVWRVLPAALVVVLAAWLTQTLRRRDFARLADAALLSRLFPSRLRLRFALRAVFATVGAIALGVALLGPVRGYVLVPLERRGVDLVIALDTSRSMLAADNEPNRLERAKKELEALLARLEGERVGLVAFAGTAWDVAPLTRDLDTVRWFLRRLSPDDNRAGGTDLGAALRHATERLDTEAKATRVIVLVTDGEDLTGEGLTVARDAAAVGAKVHILGMGTEGGAKIPDGKGRFVRDEAGAEVVTKLEDTTLRSIAEATGGLYMQAHGSVLPLERLYDLVIAGEDGRDIVDGKERIAQDRYQWPLAIGVLAWIFELALRERRSSTR